MYVFITERNSEKVVPRKSIYSCCPSKERAFENALLFECETT